jgi:hypothetical protein
MHRTNRPRIGGILTVASGILASLGAINYAIGFIAARGFSQGDIPPFVPSIIFGMPVLTIIIAALALVGGILSMRRKKWGWSLAGAIAATLSMLPLGIPALILISLSRDEFAPDST